MQCGMMKFFNYYYGKFANNLTNARIVLPCVTNNNFLPLLIFYEIYSFHRGSKRLMTSWRDYAFGSKAGSTALYLLSWERCIGLSIYK